MKFAIQFILLSCLLLNGSCSNKRQQFQPNPTNDHMVTIIGGGDSVTSITVAEENKLTDRDTVIYELPECELWYTNTLPEKYKDKGIRLWTEYDTYWENVPIINIFVSNPTNTPLEFGRAMRFFLWKNDKWCPPEQRDTSYVLAWNDDAFMIEKAPLLYCFRCKLDKYHFPKGRYRVKKTFSQGTKLFELSAEFKIE